jgi:hypothetical protein
MRKITFFKTILATVMLLVGSAGVLATTVTHTFSATSGAIDDNISFTTEKNNSGTTPAFNTQLRLYYSADGNGCSVTLLPSNGTVITEAKVTAVSGYTPTVKYNVDGGSDGEATLAGTTYTISGVAAAASLKIRNGNTTNTQLRVTAIEVTYSVPDPNTVTTPVYTVTGTEKSANIYFNTAQVSLASATSGASVYYTVDGTAPTTTSTLFTAPFNVTTTTTVKAIAVKSDMTNSAVAERLITIVAPATATVPYTEAFNNTLGDWYTYQVAGSKPWGPSANGATVNGYSGGDVESWLISPQLSSPLAGLALSFNYASRYIGNPISVKVSQNYIGYGSPAAATWTELTSIAAPTVPDNDYTVKASGNIITPLSGNLHFALVYDMEAEYSDWRITNASVVVAPAPNTPAITVTEVSMPVFLAIVGNKDTAAIHVSAVNLTADVSLVISGTDAAKFAVEPATLAPTSGTLAETLVNVIYQPTAAGTHTATLTLSSTGAASKVYELSGTAFVTTGAGTVENPFTVADVKMLNNSLAAGPKYWAAGYIVGVPSGGNTEGNLTAVDLEAPFTAATAIALSDAQSETDLTKMIGVQLPTGAVRTALNLLDNATNLNKKVKVYGTLQAYFSAAPGVYATSDYVLDPNALPSVDVEKFKVYASAGKLNVMAVDNEQITVIDVLGKQVYSNRLNAGLNIIDIPLKGMLVVKIGQTVTKVIL